MTTTKADTITKSNPKDVLDFETFNQTKTPSMSDLNDTPNELSLQSDIQVDCIVSFN